MGQSVAWRKPLRTHFDRSYAVSTGDLHHAILALGMALDLGHGDEVLVSPIESRGRAALSMCGATLVLGILRARDLAIDDVWLKEVLTERTPLMLVPHTGWVEVDHSALQRAAADHGAPLLAALTGLGTGSRDDDATAAHAEVVGGPGARSCGHRRTGRSGPGR